MNDGQQSEGKRECQVCGHYGRLTWRESIRRWICNLCIDCRVGR